MNGGSHFESVLTKQIERKVFDNIFSITHLYNSAARIYAANPIRINPFFMSIIFQHYKQLTELSEQQEEDTSYT
jgi:hypothetical protein